MNKVLNIILCIALATSSWAQKSNFKTGKNTTKHYYTEIKYKTVNGKMIIPVSINGISYRFLFDTGAPNLISTALWKTINSKPIKSISVSDANQKKQQMQLASIKNLTIGDVTFKDTRAIVFNSEGNLLFDCLKLDGIIGSNLLTKSVVQIQSNKKLLILASDPKNLKLNENYASKLTLVGNQSSPYITIKLEGEDSSITETLLFDTGASGFYDLCKKNYEQLRKKNIAQILSRSNGASSIGLFGTAEKGEHYRLLMPKLRINNHAFTNVVTETGDDNNSTIGSDILDHGIITLDFVNKKFFFDAFEPNTNLEEKLLGFTPTLNNNKLVVGFVWDKHLKDKINFGDEIIEINGVDYQDKEVCDLITKTSVFKKTDTLDLIIKSKSGDIKELKLYRKQYGDTN